MLKTIPKNRNKSHACLYGDLLFLMDQGNKENYLD